MKNWSKGAIGKLLDPKKCSCWKLGQGLTTFTVLLSAKRPIPSVSAVKLARTSEEPKFLTSNWLAEFLSGVSPYPRFSPQVHPLRRFFRDVAVSRSWRRENQVCGIHCRYRRVSFQRLTSSLTGDSMRRRHDEGSPVAFTSLVSFAEILR